MNDKETLAEWERNYRLLQTDEAKWQLFAHLKAQPGKVARQALENVVAIWMKE